jgi:endonuclease-3
MRPRQRAEAVLGELANLYPVAVCELDYQTPWQLLVATVLSAQCTDERVNTTTPELFRRWPDPEAMAGAPRDELEEVIRPTGFFRNKARNLQKTAQSILADHGGDVPREFDELIALPGVGRKTAKVVLGEAFGIAAGIAVDTHVKRLAHRIGLSSNTDPDRIATDLEDLVPRREWVDFSKRMILHGRRVCSARRPDCDECPLAPVCARLGV